MRLIIFGAPASGKDTLAEQLVAQQDLTMISTGDIFRTEADRKTTLGLKAKNEYWGRGLLCPDDLTNALITNRVNSLAQNDPPTENIIFNGYPRSLPQAQFLSEVIDIDMVLLLNISEDIAVKRLLGRGREDDRQDIIKARFKEYHLKTKPTLQYYRDLENCRVVEINTDNPKERVYRAALYLIQNYRSEK